jgi:Tfp pilus assembly PilM family ATPase
LQVEGPPQARAIRKLFACPVAGKSPEEVEKTFSQQCATEGVAPTDVLVGNPAHLCTVRLFSLPSTDQQEIRDIVELQAEKHTPYAKEEIVTDFRVLERGRAGYSRVLLVIAHQDVIHRAVRLLERSGVPLERLGCELEGLINWFQLVKRRAGAPPAAGASLVIEVDEGMTTFLVMHQGQPQFHRTLPTGTAQLHDDPAQVGQRLLSELQRSLEAVDAEGGTAKIQEVLLTGRIERLGELKGVIEQGLGLPVSLVAPWVEPELPEAARKACERLPDVSFASLVGLALAPSEIDLTPQTTKLRQVFEVRARSIVLLACQGMAALVLITCLMIGRAQKEQRYYTVLQRTYQERTQETARVTEALEQIEFVKRRLRQRGQLLEAVNELAKLSPPGIQWESLAFTQGETVVLKGVSAVLPKVYEFVASLEAVPLFRQVEAKRVSKRKAGGADVTDFEIHCSLTSGGV